jgi:hypothetical protein
MTCLIFVYLRQSAVQPGSDRAVGSVSLFGSAVKVPFSNVQQYKLGCVNATFSGNTRSAPRSHRAALRQHQETPL